MKSSIIILPVVSSRSVDLLRRAATFSQLTEEAFLLPTQHPRVPRDFFSLLLSWWTVLRSNPSSAKLWISQLQLVVTSRAKY